MRNILSTNTFCALLCLLWFMNTGEIRAQNNVFPVNVSAQPIMSTSVYLGDLANPLATAERLKFTLTLRDPITPQRQVYFRISVVENGTIVLQSDPNYVGSTLTLQKDIPQTINGADLADYLNLNHLFGASGNSNSAVLDEGVNDICLQVMDLERGVPISDRICATGYFAQLDAPLLTLPINEAEIMTGQMQSIMFNWHVPNPLANLPGVQITYHYELRQLAPGLNPQDAFESQTLVYEADVNQTVINYTEIPSPLEVDQTYLWRVTAIVLDETGQPIPEYFVNNGISEISQFAIVPTETPGAGGVACGCEGPGCDVTITTFDAAAIEVGDEIKVGRFNMTITELDGQNGRGEVELPFLNTTVEVDFYNLQVNESHKMFGGLIEVAKNAILSGLAAQANGALDMVGLGEVGTPFIDELNSLTAEATSFAELPISLRNQLEGTGFDLPFDVTLVALYFTAYGAQADLMMLVPDGSGGYLKFGASGIGFRPGGIDLADLRIFLAEDAGIPGLSQVPITLLKAVASDPAVGSYVKFGCDGFELFNLQATYQFDPAKIIRTDEPGEEGAVATFTIQGSSLRNFIANVQITPFAITGLEDYDFTVGAAVLDMDSTQNFADMAFPEGYDDPGESWKGFYLTQLGVALPEEIQIGNTGRMNFSANNLLIDSTGVSCGLTGLNLLNLSTGNAGGWGISLDSLQLNIAQNDFLNCTVAGQINMDAIGAQVTYNGLLYKDENEHYAFDLSPIGSLVLPFLKISATLDEGSLITIRKVQSDTTAPWNYKPYADLNITANVILPEQLFLDAGLGPVVDLVKTGLGALGISVTNFDFGVQNVALKSLKINHPDLPPGKTFGLGSIEGGQVLVAGHAINLQELAMLEENIPEIPASLPQLPGLGLNAKIGFGLFGFEAGVWAKKNLSGPKFSFNKVTLKMPKLPKVQFSCACTGSGGFCASPLPTNFNSLPTVPLVVGDVVKVGHFQMSVTAVNGSAGEGKIQMPFLGKEMEVKWDAGSGVTFVNQNGIKWLKNGYIYSKAASLIPENLASEMAANAAENVPIDLSALPIGDFMSGLDSYMNSLGDVFKLPFSVKTVVNEFLQTDIPGDFDFILMGMRFQKDKATVSSMITFKVPDGPFLKFGIAGLNIRPDGINLDGVQIYLAENVTLGF